MRPGERRKDKGPPALPGEGERTHDRSRSTDEAEGHEPERG